MKKNLKRTLSKTWFRVVAVILLLGILQLSLTGYLIAVTPAAVRNPKFEHYHFRMQVVVGGVPQNFNAEKYQVAYSKDQCSVDLTTEPIHFHDQKDQITHIHWDGMTGGLVMKYYGWNFIVGDDGALGYRLDKGLLPRRVKIHGQTLPRAASNATYYVYTGDENNHTQRSFTDWKNQNLEDFFGVSSNLPANTTMSWPTRLKQAVFPKVAAHDTGDGIGHDHQASETQEQKLLRINNLLGNVVVFAQKTPPSEEQVKARFNDLEPLTESSCGG